MLAGKGKLIPSKFQVAPGPLLLARRGWARPILVARRLGARRGWARPVSRCLALYLHLLFLFLNKRPSRVSHIFGTFSLSESRKEHSTTKESSFWGGGGGKNRVFL